MGNSGINARFWVEVCGAVKYGCGQRCERFGCFSGEQGGKAPEGRGGVPYGKYIGSTLLGFLPMVAAFSVMGMSAHDMTSPAFIISAGLQLGTTLAAGAVYVLIRRRRKKEARRQKE